MRRQFARTAIITAALLAFTGIVGCTGEPTASPSASPSTASPSPTAASPRPTTTPQASPSATATASPPRDEGGDGTVVDEPAPAPSASGPGGKASVDVTVTIAEVDGGELRAAAVVGTISEDGGACELTASRDGREVAVSGEGIGTARSVACADGLAIPVERLSRGAWSVVVSYDSDLYTGESAPVTVEVR